MTLLQTHGLLIALLLASQAALLVHILRRKYTEAHSRSWLSTLPVTRAHVTRRIALRTFAWPLLALVVLTVWLHPAGFESIVTLWIATAAGSAGGWFIPARHSEQASAPTPPVTSSAPLHGWVHAQAKTWLRPRTLARSLIPATLALPMGISGNDAIAMLVLWAVAIHLAILLRAFVRVARDGANWLAPTPMPFHRFAWSLTRDPLLRQVLWTATAAIVLIALGCAPSLALRIAEGWLTLVAITTALSLAHAQRGTPMRWELLGSACVLAAIERFTQHAALPCALVFSAWRLRRIGP